MRVLWFTNIILPEASVELNLPVFLSGGWLEGYLSALREHTDVHLIIITRSHLVSHKVKINVKGVEHIVLPLGRIDITAKLSNDVVKEYLAEINDAYPDIIHFHGSEYHYGLLQAGGHLSAPAVLSIQGLMSECARVYFGGLSIHEIIHAHTLGEIRYRSGIFGDWLRFRQRAIIEKSIIKSMLHVIGRTRWDRAHVKAMNSSVVYHHCEELLRPAFYQTERINKNVQRYSIFTTSATYPLKGFHVLLKAVALLKDDYPEITIRIAISQNINGKVVGGYSRFLQKLIKELKLTENIKWLGPQNDAGMAKALATSHIFVVPSFVENRSNSLAEAMMIGVPSVASLVGGMTCTVKDLSTALCFPVGDIAMLSECIRMLFGNNDLADRLALNAQTVARKRHDSKLVAHKLYSIYHSILHEGSRIEPYFEMEQEINPEIGQ
jgi:L-malate glycosyltransferase